MLRFKGLFKAFIFFSIILGLAACGDKPPALTPLSPNAVILAYGDSLTYGYGADPKTESYPAVLAKLSGRKVVNEGIPGEVSRDGLARLHSVLDETNPQLVILCHGGNDLIRKSSKEALKSNLDKMITMIQASGAEVMLIAVPNYSIMLTMPKLYEELAETHNIPIQRDIIQKVEADRALKSDQVHPNAAGYKLMGEAVHKVLVDAGALQ